MKALGISGSPRKGGNSDVAAKAILEALRHRAETEFIRIADYTIEHCIGCGRCRTLQRCVIEHDDLHLLLEKWKAADLLVVSAPVYWLSPPGVMKDFIDRTVSLNTHPVPPFNGKRVALVTVAAENGFELQYELLSRWLRHYGARIVGHIDVYAWERDELLHDAAQMARLQDFAAEIVGKMNGGG
jgi:multimeric flavodoxin WrbA